jgi:glycerate 2-kinase
MDPPAVTSARQQLADIFRHGVQAVHGTASVSRTLQSQPVVGEVAAIAIGKAAAAMLQGVRQALGTRLHEALLISKNGHYDPAIDCDERVTCLQGGHPVPDENSLIAGKKLLAFIRKQPPQRSMLFLLSGGASSLVEVLREGLELQDLQRANRWLLGCGLDIAAMNRVRQTLSRIKGGRLRAYLDGRSARVLLISDVPGNDLSTIGSGLLFPPQPAVLPAHLPDWLTELSRADTTPGNDAIRVEHCIVASLSMALQAAAGQALHLGYNAQVMDAELTGDAEENAVKLARYMRSCRPGVYLWGGETTVRLPPDCGQGGRNQQLALRAAVELAGCPDTLLLAAGTDGNDGNTQSAGATVDAATVERAALHGMDARQCLRRADAGTCLAASGDLLITGPTGTNVMDMIIGMKLPAVCTYD